MHCIFIDTPTSCFNALENPFKIRIGLQPQCIYSPEQWINGEFKINFLFIDEAFFRQYLRQKLRASQKNPMSFDIVA
jgi:hypothetical protein